ncbi:putative dehydrogenase [Pseudomonas sp. GM102]|uniref:Gfo/Idh/MocA family protein n=1 Tax=Pseudomonas sp. GM102 TaxID=1144321 RepID=UPI00026F6F1F|nr:Gfo/Idh/MocA family oxidoreductase [Pseudomonas sp. GM102]EJM00319.1 putative dehydrogenase [Pseudomonas sp. GM102]
MTLNIGVIGSGAIGQDHMRRCHFALNGSRVTAVNDINLEQAQRALKTLGIAAEVYADGHELIRSKEVDAILVTSWGPSHEEFVLSAISEGKPVFCEKPLAVTAEGCRRIIEAEIAHGKRLVQVGYMRPWDKGYNALREEIRTGDLGVPLMVHCKHRNPEVNDAYTTNMAVSDTLVHELDVLRWLLDDDYVSAQVVFPRVTRHAHSNLRDPQIVLLETAKGVRIDVEIFVNCKYGYDIQCEVVCEDGTAELAAPPSPRVRHAGSNSQHVLLDWKQRFIEAYDHELQAFVDGASKGQIQGPSAWNGFAAALAADACAEAQISGAIVPINMPARPAFYDPN